MPAMNDTQRSFIRSHVGSTSPTDAVLNALFESYGNVEQVVENVLSTRLADFVSTPASFGVGRGKYTQNTSANISALKSQLEEFRNRYMGGEGGGYRVVGKALERIRSCRCTTNICVHGQPAILR